MKFPNLYWYKSAHPWPSAFYETHSCVTAANICIWKLVDEMNVNEVFVVNNGRLTCDGFIRFRQL
jgi:hypothetical protein